MNVYRAVIYAPEIEDHAHIGIALDISKAKKMCEAELETGEFLHWVRITPSVVHGYFDEGLDDKGNPKELFNYYILMKEKLK